MKKRTDNWLINDNRPVSVDVSCIVYNHGKYLRKALDGMLMQETDFPVRIIIHDDASTDNSGDIIREYSSRFPEKIVAVLEEKNLYQNGQSIWLKMFPYFTAKYIAHCEGDDFWLDNHKLQKQVDYLEKNPDCVAVYHNVLPVDINGIYNEQLRWTYPVLEEGDYSEEELRSFVLKTQLASLVRRNFNPWMTEREKEFYCHTHCNGDAKILVISGILGRVHYLPDVMAAHRRVLNEGDSWSARQNKKSKSEKRLFYLNSYLEQCRLYNYFSDNKIYPYNRILHDSIEYYKDALNEGRSFKEARTNLSVSKIPFYAYLIYVPFFIKRTVGYIIRRLKS